MPDRVQDLTNHRKVAVACKNYTDKEVKKAKDELITFFSRNTVDTDDHTNELAYQITAPSGAKLLQLQAIGGNTVKLSPSVASDSTKAMIKTMPETVYDFDVSKVYGASEKATNLSLGTINANVNSSGVLEYSSVFKVLIIQATVGKTYYLQNNSVNQVVIGYYSSMPSLNSASIDGTRTVVENTNSFTATSSNYIAVRFPIDDANASVVEYTGIHNLELSGLKVESENLMGLENISSTVKNGVTYSVNNGAISLNGTASTYTEIGIVTTRPIKAGTYSIKLFKNATPNTWGYFRFYDSDSTLLLEFDYKPNDQYTNFNLSRDVSYIVITIGNGMVFNNFVMTPMLLSGATAPTYFVPYVSQTLPIDLTSIEDSGGNKLFADGSLKGVGSVYDEITPYKTTKRMGIVDLGSLSWTIGPGDSWVTNNTIGMRESNASVVYEGAFISSKYDLTAVNGSDIWKPNTITCITQSNGLRINIGTTDITPSGYLVYELATPIEVSIDWSATLRNIQGYPNGSIIAENTHNMDVESVITYNSIIQETLCPSVTVDSANIFDKTLESGTWTNTYPFEKQSNNQRVRSNNYIDVLPNTTYTISNSGNKLISVREFNNDKTILINDSGFQSNNYSFTTSNNTKYIIIILASNSVSEVGNLMLNRGSTALSYRPYKAPITRNLPTITSDGYGVNANAHNLRVFSDYEGNETKERPIIVGKVDLGSLTYNKQVKSNAQGEYKFVTDLTASQLGIKPSTSNILCSMYEVGNINASGTDMVMTVGTYVSFVNNSYTDATTFKTAMSGVYLYYELATEDISQLDDFDFFFDVEEGDVITFNNPYAQQVYATYSFLIKEAKSNE